MSFDVRKFAKSSKKQCLLFLLLLFHLTVVTCGPTTNYCTITCRREKHTVCKRRHNCSPVKGCQYIEPTVEFRELMVKQHNELRNKIASGGDGSQYGNKGAKNMNAVSYDMEMEYIAQCWANTCRTLEHDKCRSSKRFSCGQNIYWGSNTNETTHGVQAWYNEIQYMTNPAWIDKLDPNSYPNDKKQRGHFTQLIWADNKYIGCARVRYGKDHRQTQLICNYGPAGNVLGQSIYKMAGDSSQIATQCKGGRNSEYSSLCGKIEPIPTEKCWAGAASLVSNVSLVLCLVLFAHSIGTLSFLRIGS